MSLRARVIIIKERFAPPRGVVMRLAALGMLAHCALAMKLGGLLGSMDAKKPPQQRHFDLVVIGGGSGGLALLTGELVSAEKAEKIGLINKVLDDSLLQSYTLEIARKISKKSSMTLKIGKAAFYKQVDMNLSEAYDYASKVMVDNMLKADAEEGIDAFIEKRNPNWQDK